MLYNINCERPEKPIKPSILNVNYILSLLNPMAYKFVNNNINYYLIEIKILKKYNLQPDMLYKLSNNNKWVYKKRKLLNSIPCII